MKADLSEKFLALIVYGRVQLQRENYEVAEQLFRMAKILAFPLLSDLAPLAIYNLAILRLRQGRREESKELREQATARLEKAEGSSESCIYQDLMASALFQLGDYRRAIPFCERAMQFAWDENDPVMMAEMLYRAGVCYAMSGLRDHAVVPLRGAVKIFRNCPGDPRLPAALNDLGNALRSSSPVEAESYYKEAADLHDAKGEVESATVAWSNLGILCSKQGRHAESLEYHQRVLRVREASSSRPPERLGSALNNIANCYRRMGRFTEAHQLIDRAIAVLEPNSGTPLPSAYGTRGLIFEDEGKDAEAIEWLQKAYTARMALPSPDLESVADDLEHEIAAFKRSGRADEAAAAEQRLAYVRAKMEVARPVQRDLGALESPTEGAVLIELCRDKKIERTEWNNRTRKLIDELSEVVEREKVGFAGGEVVIPENTTLMLYGADGEALFKAVEPILTSQPICEGGIVTVRQGSRHRIVALPRSQDRLQ